MDRTTKPSAPSRKPEPRLEPLITTPEALAELAAHLRHCGRFAFDTEFVSEETFSPVLCLVQVATRERLVLIDPMAVGDLSVFWQAVADPAIEVVMHAAGEDLRICRLQSGLVPRGLFDVQIASALVGFGYPLSLGNLASQVLGVALAGGETRTDWRKRPLSPSQLEYAIEDVRHLLDLADRVQERLRTRGRAEWAAIEMQSFLEAIVARDSDERWRRLPGLNQLSRRGLEVARRLSEWRIKAARRSNRPVRQVLRDDLLVAIAKRQPTQKRDLEALREFNRPHLLRNGPEILEIIGQARAVPDDHLPERGDRHEEGPGLAMVVSLLAAALNRACAEHEVAVGLAGTTSDLKDLTRWHIEGRPAAWTPALLRGWRKEVCGQTLLEVLAGRLALRVVDPRAEVPVTLEEPAKGASGQTHLPGPS